MLSDAFAKALKNLLLPEIMKLFLFCLAAYLIGGFLLAALLGHITAAVVGAGGIQGAFVGAIATLGGGWLAWFFFPLLYPLLMGFFDDYMAEAIERNDYPALSKAAPPFWPTLMQDAWFSVKALLLNLLLVPLYLIPLLGWILYFGVNGLLLGRQFFRMAAGRRSTKEEAIRLSRKHRGAIFLSGLTVMVIATIPILNLAAPILGVATLLHLYHMAVGNDRQQVLL